MPQEVLSPDTGTGKPIGGSNAKTADQINDMFSELDNEPAKKEPESESKTPEKKEKELESKDDDELDLVEDEEEEKPLKLDEEEDLEVSAPPRKKEILKEYPELFKKFPFLEKMMYRDQQYTEKFGSFDDAMEIADKAEGFNNFESQLLAGNTEEVLRSVKDTDQRAFDIIVDDYLPTLFKVDKDSYYHVVGNLNRKLIQELAAEADKNTGEAAENLRLAALMINQYVFGNSTFTPPKNRVDKSAEPEKQKVEEERLNFVREQYETHRDEMQTRVDNRLRATISEYIDPRGQMSGYVKRNAVNDAMKYLQEALGNDESIVRNLNKLWKIAVDGKYRKDSLGRIESYYLSKAKSNLKKAILQSRSEALKDSRPAGRDKETDDVEEDQPRQRQTQRIPTGRPSQPKSKNEMKKGETVMDFFMRGD